MLNNISEYARLSSYTVFIVNDTPYTIDLIFTATGCGGVFTGRPAGHCTDTKTLNPAEVANHEFKYTQFEGILYRTRYPDLRGEIVSQWCSLPLDSIFAGEVIYMSRIINLVGELISRGHSPCTPEIPSSWYRVENVLAVLFPHVFAGGQAARWVYSYLRKETQDDNPTDLPSPPSRI